MPGEWAGAIPSTPPCFSCEKAVHPTMHLYSFQASTPEAPPLSVHHNGLFLDTPPAHGEPPFQDRGLGRLGCSVSTVQTYKIFIFW